MIHYRSRKAFSMVELVFVIVVIGILAAIAVPKLSATRDDAEITNAINTVASVRSALSTERQKRILRSEFGAITSLSKASHAGYNKPIFDGVNGDTNSPLLEYTLYSCKDADATACWYTADNITYTYKMPADMGSVDFNLTNSKFNCKNESDANCITLTR